LTTRNDDPCTCNPRPARRRTTPIALLGALMALAVFAMPATASASHFRYGQMSWQQTSGNTVDITVTTAWRSSFLDGVFLQFGDSGSASLSVGEATNLGTFSDSTGQSYTILRWTVSHTYPGAGPYTASFDSCCRIGALTNASNGSYRVASVVDMNAGNSGSPASAVPVITQMVQGGVNVLPLPIAEPDGDAVSCRLATAAESGIPAQPAAGGSALSVSSDCVISWDTSGTSVGQLYAYQVIMEDGSSSTALDGMIEIVDGTLNAPPTCLGGGNFTVAPGQTLMVDFIGDDPDGGALNSSIAGLPPGSSFGPTSGSAPLTSTFTWTPSLADLGSAYAASVQFQDAGFLSANCGLGVSVICEDDDGDGVCNEDDNCPLDANADQLDSDGDLAGDACDVCPYDADDDIDGDGVCGDVDNCVDDANSDQANADGDSYGDVCDVCPNDANDDADGDGICGDQDNCPDDANLDQADFDGDGEGDVCDPDDDGDGIDDGDDLCPDTAASDSDAGVPERYLGTNRWADIDGDGVFDTIKPRGNGPQLYFDMADTAGCSCAQIIEELDLGNGHTKFGCSISAMEDWSAIVARP
jgi:hypothetical protein